MKVTFRLARAGDMTRIANRMAAIDVLECAAFKHSPKRALRIGLRASLEAWTALIDDKPEAMFGIAAVSIVDGVGAPWFLGTDKAREPRRLFMTLAPTLIARMHGHFRVLENHVHDDNVAAIRWLSRLGFAVEPQIVDIGGQPMRRFWREYPHVRTNDPGVHGRGLHGPGRGRRHLQRQGRIG